MPWTSSSFNHDTDNAELVTLTSIYTDTDGTTFSCSARADTMKGLSTYVELAKQALSDWLAKKQDVSTQAQKILNLLNS